MSLTLQTTHGNIKIELHCELCPKACKNFLALAASGYYNGTVFHRNIKGKPQSIKDSLSKEVTQVELERRDRVFMESHSKMSWLIV
jgi:cyclophilin family peptidyl-prolyl cis-trans isomerase